MLDEIHSLKQVDQNNYKISCEVLHNTKCKIYENKELSSYLFHFSEEAWWLVLKALFLKKTL